jgi:hypothetical protein
MAAYDQRELGKAQIALRILLAVLIMTKPIEIYGAASVAGVALIFAHAFTSKQIIAAGDRRQET